MPDTHSLPLHFGLEQEKKIKGHSPSAEKAKQETSGKDLSTTPQHSYKPRQERDRQSFYSNYADTCETLFHSGMNWAISEGITKNSALVLKTDILTWFGAQVTPLFPGHPGQAQLAQPRPLQTASKECCLNVGTELPPPCRYPSPCRGDNRSAHTYA